MRSVFTILLVLLPIFAFSQLREFYDFDNYSLNPAMVEPDHQLEADVFYASDFVNSEYISGANYNLHGQLNYWVGSYSNVGLSWSRNKIGSEVRNRIRVNYSHLFEIRDLQLIPAVSLGYQNYNLIIRNNNVLYPGPWHANTWDVSLGLGAIYKNFKGGLYFNRFLQFSDENIRQLESQINSHFAYAFQLSPKFELEPFVRGLFVTEDIFKWQGGLLATLAEKYELRASYISIERNLRGGLGFNLNKDLWLRYRYNLTLSDFARYNLPNHLFALSFNLAAVQEE